MKNILALGCSFTYGAELADETLTSPSQLAWPSLLANKLSANVTNLGRNGGSNSRIYRLAVENTLKHDYDLVICAWTDIMRLDITYQGEEMPVTINSSWIDKDFSYLKTFIVNHHDERHILQTWMTQVLTLQEFFKRKNQKYLFLNMPGTFYKHHLEIQQLEYFIDSIDSKYFMGWDEGRGMVDWQGDCPLGPAGHPLEIGHQRIANKIYEHISNLGWNFT
jgi:hypothetical protein